MGDRVAQLAGELVDAAMLEVRESLGEAPISFRAELAAQQAAHRLVDAAVEAALGRYRAAAADRDDLTL